ncbi:DUF2218 domain-containing protein [Rhizobium rhizogenes]|uniref:DUF2218 domain-containing protein n=1 Tax=Rhizobium rhizogenes TaxID=359 RepID=UPI001F36585C|nr:DUF2218 domain-containing protein [Rhizobium rhizogenes]
MQASTIIRSDRAGALVTDFAERFRDVANVEAEGGKATLISRYGRADLTAQGDAISIAVAAKDQIDLCYIKMVVAEYFSSAAAPDAVRWSGDGEAESSLPPFSAR